MTQAPDRPRIDGSHALRVGLACGPLFVCAVAACGARTEPVVDPLADASLPDSARDASTASARCAPARVPDFNGDGLGDFALVTSPSIAVYYGARGRIPTTPTTFLPRPATLTVDATIVSSVGDLDGDGTSELAIYRRSAQTSPDLPGSPFRAGTLYIARGSRAGLDPRSLTLVDAPPGFEDNFPDDVRFAGRIADTTRAAFVVTLTQGRGAFVYVRASDGRYASQTTVPVGLDASGDATDLFVHGAGDLDGDGFDDLAAATDREASRIAGGASGVWGPSRQSLYTDIGNRVGPYFDGVGDVTRDGCADAMLLSFAGGGSFRVFAGGVGFGTAAAWAPRASHGRPIAVNGTTDFIPVGDADGDGTDDVLVFGTCLSGAPCTGGTYERLLYRGAPSGLAEAAVALPALSTQRTSLRALGDLDGDGRHELGELTSGSTSLVIWRGTLSGYVVTARTTVTRPDVAGRSFTGATP
mgnify:CR=1 FL=1